MPHFDHQQARLAKLLNNLAADFNIDKLSKSSARFNLDKLNWFNREYIKMLSLDEFAYKAAQLKLDVSNQPTKNLRPGNYVYLTDFQTQKVLVSSTENSLLLDGNYHLPGGSQENNQDPLKFLQREIQEKTPTSLNLEPQKFIHLTKFAIIPEQAFTYKGQTWDGQEMNLYVYACNQDDIPTPLTDQDSGFEYQWVDLAEVLAQNQYLTYPVWKEFCLTQNLPVVEPNSDIIRQYLGWYLDKNRVTVLSEVGSESDCLQHWQAPEPETLKWKKISLLESQNNLQEIHDFILNQQTDLSVLEQNLFQKAKKNLLNDHGKSLIQDYLHLQTQWENRIKTWLQENQKDIGSYLWPLRVALSGKAKSPSPFEILAILEAKTRNSRIQSCLQVG